MRASLVALVVAGCGGGVGSDGDPHERVACEAEWTSELFDPVGGCDAPCADRDALGPTEGSCTILVERAEGMIMEPCGATYIEWHGHRGCCRANGPEELIEFHDCLP